MSKDLNLLTKMLAQTESDVDPEALAALRAVQRQMKKMGVTWAMILAGHAAPVEEDPETKTVNDAITDIRAVLKGPSGFLDSIEAQWRETQTLTINQKNALMRMARDARAGGARR